MKISYILLLSPLFFILACAPNSENEARYIQLEKNIAESPGPDEINELISAYNEYISENFPDGKDLVNVYEKAYNFTNNHRKNIAPNYLTGLIRLSDKDVTKRSDWLDKLALALEEQGKTEAAYVIYGNIAKLDPAYSKNNIYTSKLKGLTSDAIVDSLASARMTNADNFGINSNAAIRFVDASEAYALSNPTGERTPSLLFDAAEMAKILRTNDKALSLYDWLIQDYPNYEKTPSALFIKAFVLENELNNLEEARKAYESFLEKYPDDDFADDAKFSLENLGKSADEVLKIIEEKNNQ